jgi:hypothetical protein
MGNHEYCEDCGISSFHLDRPCDPEKVAAIQAAAKARKAARQAAFAATRKRLDDAGLQHDGEFWRDDAYIRVPIQQTLGGNR